jgi:PAS domain S-box-containing protein
LPPFDQVSDAGEIYALVVEDDENFGEVAAAQLEYMGEDVEVDLVESPQEAVSAVENREVSAVISGYDLAGDMDGVDLLETVKAYDPEMPFVFYTGEGSEDVAVEAMRHGADEYIRQGEQDEFQVMADAVESAQRERDVGRELDIFKRIVEEAGHAVKITDTEGDLVYVNDTFRERTGYDWSEAVGREPGEIVGTGEQEDGFYQEMWDTVLSGEVWEGEMVNQAKDGERYWIREVVFPVEGDGGEPEYLVGISNDITDRKERENLREVLNGLLRHDVSNHLNSAIGFLDLLSLEGMDEGQRQHIETIEESVDKSAELVHGVRGILQNDPGEANTERVDIDEVLEGTADEYRTKAEAKGKEIVYDSEGSAEICAGPLVGHVFGNAVENSIHHAEDAEMIELDFEELGREVEVTIADDGEGLSDDFSWGKGVKGPDSDGTGMGTWLMKEITRAYDGEIEAGESEYGGAEFRFRFERA